MSKLLPNLGEAVRLSGLRDGMTISFHHHLRNGDKVLNLVLREIAAAGVRDLRVAASSLFPVHAPLIEHIEAGVVSRLDTNYLSGPLGAAVSRGLMKLPVMFRSHGGRPRAIESGELPIDVAFIAAPAADPRGNLNGTEGPSACGSLGYAMPDALFAKKVVVITDNLVPYPLSPASIEECRVDYVVEIDSIGDPEGIVSGTTTVTRDPVGLVIARYASRVIEHSGLLVDGFSFQTGAGGASLAVAKYLKEIMIRRKIVAGFGLGGITGYFVDFLKEGLFRKLLDVQCFDLEAVESIRTNRDHREISASAYANPKAKGCAVDSLDIVVLGATEIDTDFNVNVTTDSNGIIMGGAGGHSDAAAGAKLAVSVAPLVRSRLPIVVDRVLTVTTPGRTVDVLVTDRGVAVNPERADLRDRLRDAGLPLKDIHDLKREAERYTGSPRKIRLADQVVGTMEYRDGTILDEVRRIEE